MIDATDSILEAAGLDVEDEIEGEEEAPAVEGEDAEEEAEEGSEEEEAESEESEEEADVEAIAPPSSWSDEDKKVFAELEPAAQAIIARRETERDNYIRKTGREKAEAVTATQNEARQYLAKQAENHALALQVYAEHILPQKPDERLLYTQDPNDVTIYHRQNAVYQAGLDQQQQLHQSIAQAQQQAQSARSQVDQATLVADQQKLQEQLPEWFDPSSGPKLQQDLQSIGAELGYPVELMAEASSTDIIALKTASDWKAKAEKYDKLMAGKMEGVRAAKGLPKMAKPGVKLSKGAVSANKRDASWQRVKATKSGEDMADWLEKSGII